MQKFNDVAMEQYIYAYDQKIDSAMLAFTKREKLDFCFGVSSQPWRLQLRIFCPSGCILSNQRKNMIRDFVETLVTAEDNMLVQEIYYMPQQPEAILFYFYIKNIRLYLFDCK